MDQVGLQVTLMSGVTFLVWFLSSSVFIRYVISKFTGLQWSLLLRVVSSGEKNAGLSNRNKSQRAFTKPSEQSYICCCLQNPGEAGRGEGVRWAEGELRLACTWANQSSSLPPCPASPSLPEGPAWDAYGTFFLVYFLSVTFSLCFSSQCATC